jgi:hypothetical protein
MTPEAGDSPAIPELGTLRMSEADVDVLSSSPSSETTLYGLFDGFDGYQTPTADDHQAVLTSGIVVPDANVLLNLYRYTEQSRDDLLSVLERLGAQLWIPHQVLVEFWRNREGVLRDPRDTEKTAQEMSQARTQAVARFRTWANRVSLPGEESAALMTALSDGFDVVIQGIQQFNDASAIEAARDTDKDPVLKRLDTILAGKVGAPLDGSAHTAAVKEGLRRVTEREPPGYLDKDKDDHISAGDYLVWEQVLVEAVRRRCDVLFITGDVKDDWWRREGGEQRGPRLELCAEMRQRADVRLFMMRPAVLLSIAREVLSLTVSDESVENTDNVDRLVSAGTLLDGGWTADAVQGLLERLADEAPVQKAVIERAALDGGFVDRETVYLIGDYPEERSLRGFTRPVNRIAQTFRDEGRIDESAVDVLEAVYLAMTVNPNLAEGFRLNARVMPLVGAVLERR